MDFEQWLLLLAIVNHKYARYNVCSLFFFQAEDGIRDLVRSRGLGDVYKRQGDNRAIANKLGRLHQQTRLRGIGMNIDDACHVYRCLLYTSDAADERSSVDLGGRRIIKKKTQ